MSYPFEQVLPDLRKGAVAVSQGKRYKIVKLKSGDESNGKVIYVEELSFAQLADDGSDKVLAHVTLTAEQIVSQAWTIESLQVKTPPVRFQSGGVVNATLLTKGVATGGSLNPDLPLQHFSEEKTN